MKPSEKSTMFAIIIKYFKLKKNRIKNKFFYRKKRLKISKLFKKVGIFTNKCTDTIFTTALII